MTFQEALTELQAGKKVRRTSWNENVFLAYAMIDENTRYIFVSVLGNYTPYQIPQADVFADDWETLTESTE